MAFQDRRLLLDEKIREIVDNVYFQPPASVKMQYPCVRYERGRVDTVPADNLKYLKYKRWSLTLIYSDPDSDLPDRMIDELGCTHDRHYAADNLYHDVYSLVF